MARENATVHISGMANKGDGLEFRIRILNYTLYVAALFSLLFGILHDLGENDIGRAQSIIDYIYAFISIGVILLLRQSRDWYEVVTPFFVVISLICFSSALVLVTNDEFRLIWFYFLIYVTYVLLGKMGGVLVTVASIVIIVVSMLTVDLHLSRGALTTGLLGIVVIGLLSHIYSRQILLYETQLQEKNRVLQTSIRELDTALAEAWSANRAKSLFLANMSHEIRTPMNGVLGMVQVMRGTHLDNDQEHYLDAIQRAGKNLLVLIDDLLDISRIESGKLEIEPRPLSTFDWTMDVQFVTEPLFEESVVLYTTLMADDLPKWLLADGARLTQIVVNLVSNAAKFTQQGEVRLEIGGELTARDRYQLVVRVCDSGEGIPTDKLEHIFEPFEQVNPERISNKGVGLGLAISKRLAQAMGGDLLVESTGAEGSCFLLQLELPVIDKVRRVKTDVTDENFPRRLNVLLVDDDAINRLAVKALLGQMGQSVIEAEDGEFALSLLQQEPFDVVLMDVHMPRMDGVTATRMIRASSDERLASVPIIGLTASVMADEREQYLEAGMSAVAQKPIVLEQLVATIKEHLREEPVSSSSQDA